MKKLLSVLCLFVFAVTALAGPFGIFPRLHLPHRHKSACAPSMQMNRSACPQCQGQCPLSECPMCEMCPGAQKVEPVGKKRHMENTRTLDGKSFAGALQRQLIARQGRKKVGNPGERAILKILNSPDSAKRDRQVARMEHAVRKHLKMQPAAKIDWSSIDWAAVIESVLRILIKLLPLLLAL